MTPARISHIARMAVNVLRGRTVPAMCSYCDNYLPGICIECGACWPPNPRDKGWWDGRAVGEQDADGFRTEYVQSDPPEYPVLIFDNPPDTRPVPAEEYPSERTQFDRDMWRSKG